MALLLIANNGSYTNPDAIDNVLRYVTRTRKCEKRENELVYCNSLGVMLSLGIDHCIYEMEQLQRFYSINNRGGRRMFHETLELTEQETSCFDSIASLSKFADSCAYIYYQMGFQVVYAVHFVPYSDEDMTILQRQQKVRRGVHIHFAVNIISFLDGRKFHSTGSARIQRERYFNRLLNCYLSIQTLKKDPAKSYMYGMEEEFFV